MKEKAAIKNNLGTWWFIMKQQNSQAGKESTCFSRTDHRHSENQWETVGDCSKRELKIEDSSLKKLC